MANFRWVARSKDTSTWTRRTIIGAGASQMLVGCIPNPVVTYSYRLKLHIAVGGQEHTGESVIKVRWVNASREFMNYGNAYRSSVWGEAAVADLGAKFGLVFALLDGVQIRAAEHFSCTETPLSAFRGQRSKEAFFANIGLWKLIEDAPTHRDEVELRGSDRPLLVRFADIGDPKSVEEVHIDDLTKLLGRDDVLTKVSLKFTSDPVTEGIREVLPWLNDYQETLAGGGGPWSERTFPQQLTYANFRRWSK